jgi:hypothetical protein
MTIVTPQNVEVQLKPADGGKAVIEGKTAVPFSSFVTLILQRKVVQITKAWGKEPVVVSSELLTTLASAPQDSVENRSHLVYVTLGVGMILGILGFSIAQLLLMVGGFTLGIREHLLVSCVIVAIVVLGTVLARAQKKPKSDKVVETMEKVASFLGK